MVLSDKLYVIGLVVLSDKLYVYNDNKDDRALCPLDVYSLVGCSQLLM